jgi:hypothetical protein
MSGCHLFQPTEVTKKEINASSSWSEKDQGPTFEICEGLEGVEHQSCFESIISNSITNYLDQYNLESNTSIEEEILMIIKIDQEGYFALESIETSKKVKDAMPDLENSLFDAISQLPQANPAIKTNVGSYVATSFKLPIKIYAQEDH